MEGRLEGCTGFDLMVDWLVAGLVDRWAPAWALGQSGRCGGGAAAVVHGDLRDIIGPRHSGRDGVGGRVGRINGGPRPLCLRRHTRDKAE